MMFVKPTFASFLVVLAMAGTPAAAQDMITFDAGAISALPGSTALETVTFRPLLKSGGDVASVRVSIPANTDVAPHPHPAGKVAIVTVLSGEFKVGLGEKFDEAGLKTVAPGGMIVFRDNDPLHYARTGNGPVELLLVAAPKASVAPALLGAR
jgi:quercetin dioxygenase-like cupin family protein